jgi:hypothetical protein
LNRESQFSFTGFRFSHTCHYRTSVS